MKLGEGREELAKLHGTLHELYKCYKSPQNLDLVLFAFSYVLTFSLLLDIVLFILVYNRNIHIV